MTDRDQAFCCKLVQAVQEIPYLYNYTLPEYSNKFAQEKAWHIIAKEMQTSASNCKVRWRNIRTVFLRHLKRSQSGDGLTKAYYLNRHLQFLLPFIKVSFPVSAENSPPALQEEIEETNQIENVEENEPYIEENESFTEENDSHMELESAEVAPTGTGSQTAAASAVASTTIPSQPAPSFVTPDIKTEKRRKAISAVDQAFIDYCSSRTAAPAGVDSPRKMFLLSLLPDVEMMSDDQFRKFRMDVLPLIDTALLYSPSTHGGISSVQTGVPMVSSQSPSDDCQEAKFTPSQQFSPSSSGW